MLGGPTFRKGPVERGFWRTSANGLGILGKVQGPGKKNDAGPAEGV